ncbi:MAG: YciI family protein [Anaerolineaceae bacterium]
MANFLLVYRGEAKQPATEAEGEKVMAAWMGWFGSMGEAVVDGGNPISGSKSVASNGAVSDGAASGLTGYSVVKADSLDAAAKLAKGCPHLAAGGMVEVYETFNAM